MIEFFWFILQECDKNNDNNTTLAQLDYNCK